MTNQNDKNSETPKNATANDNAPVTVVDAGENDKGKDSTDWKSKHDEAGFALRQSQKVNEDQAARIKILEEKTADPQDTNAAIAELQVKLARSDAVAEHGLTREQAGRLKGSPAEILDDAKYWSEQRAKDDTPKSNGASNREMIDADVIKTVADDQTNNAQKPPATPTPKADQKGSWIDIYKASTPAERYKMDQDVKKGLVNPHN